MRGEHWTFKQRKAAPPGSSPHARGARRRRGPHAQGQGIIPACVGSTGRVRRRGSLCRDHPRMRGEHPMARYLGASGHGSSPHARGAPSHACGSVPPGRIIPACAESTGKTRGRVSSARDHPRMRGEHSSCTPHPLLEVGSSPHARGALPAQRVEHPREGIIPACAGSTRCN